MHSKINKHGKLNYFSNKHRLTKVNKIFIIDFLDLIDITFQKIIIIMCTVVYFQIVH